MLLPFPHKFSVSHGSPSQVLNLIEAAAEGVKSEASSEGPVELTEGPPPLVKCAALLPLGASRRPVVLQRTSGQQAESVFQYRAEMTAVNKDEEPPPPEVHFVNLEQQIKGEMRRMHTLLFHPW